MNRSAAWKRNLFWIWLAQLLSFAGFSSALPFIPLYIGQVFGIVDERERGMYVAAFYFFGMLSFCISAPLWGALGDRYGRRLMLLRSYWVSAFLFPALMLAPNVFWLIGLRFLVSSFSGSTNAAQALVVTTTPEKNHGFALGILSSAMWSGNMLGYLLGGAVVDHFGYTCAFIGCGVTYALGGAVTLLFVHERFVPVARPAGKWRPHLPRYSSLVWGLLTIFFLIALARRFDEPFIALQVEAVGGGERAAWYTGIISAFAALGGILSGATIGYLCDRFSPDRVARPSILLCALAMLGQGYAANLGMLGVARFLLFFAAGGLEPVFLSKLSASVDAGERGALFGLAASIRVMGLLAGSALGGMVVMAVGIRGIFVSGALCFLLLLPAMKVLAPSRKRRAVMFGGRM